MNPEGVPIDPLAAYRPTSKKRATKVYPIAFALVAKGKRFQYRAVQAVKTSQTEAVLIPSGKFVKIAGDKVVKVKP